MFAPAGKTSFISFVRCNDNIAIGTSFYPCGCFPATDRAASASLSVSKYRRVAFNAIQFAPAGLQSTNFEFCFVTLAAIRSWLSFVGIEFAQWKELLTGSAILSSRVMRTRMKIVMLAARNELQVVRIVVPRTAIFVMNFLATLKRASDDLLHDDSMLKSLFAVNTNKSVAVGREAPCPIRRSDFTRRAIKSPSAVVHVAPSTTLTWAIASSNFAICCHSATINTRSLLQCQALIVAPIAFFSGLAGLVRKSKKRRNIN
jgi:hypothetical protein